MKIVIRKRNLYILRARGVSKQLTRSRVKKIENIDCLLIVETFFLPKLVRYFIYVSYWNFFFFFPTRLKKRDSRDF